MNVFLIGFRCTGKTVVGRLLAKSLALRFVDTDDVVVRAMGPSIRAVVAEKGWDHFRRWEEKIMAAVCAADGQVVGTGGGVILIPETIRTMKKSGTVVWLKASPKTIARRMERDSDSRDLRPSLTGKPVLIEIGEVLSQRKSLYRQAADLELVTDDKSPESIAAEIIRSLNRSNKGFKDRRAQR